MPRSVAHDQTESRIRALAEDVAYYLTQSPRQLPSQYLYDELGSSLFEAICRLPWYPITRAEQWLLKTHRKTIFSRLSFVSTVVELGPGDGEKLVTLMGGQSERNATIHLVDVSAAALDQSAAAISSQFAMPIVVHQATYEEGLSQVGTDSSGGRRLVLFLGSNIGNFDPPGADAFLGSVRGGLRPGDGLLLGTDLVRSESELLLAYDDPLGVTAAFNRNLLLRVNRELGADFDIMRFAHRAIWNAPASRVEMHLISLDKQHVRVPASEIEITFEIGEPIWTESSYKYRIDEVGAMLERSGFRRIGQWIDNNFALTLAEAV
jgi:dimethylhistidine N-methyltransferase